MNERAITQCQQEGAEDRGTDSTALEQGAQTSLAA